ncbi:Glucose-6-phosphate 1-dehydrogenase [Sarcoptes scabiei]|nr:Glucose-6-phosphate 1-dehydrogenase [Sarcoptes scabiei]
MPQTDLYQQLETNRLLKLIDQKDHPSHLSINDRERLLSQKEPTNSSSSSISSTSTVSSSEQSLSLLNETDSITIEKFWEDCRKSFQQRILPIFFIKTLRSFEIFSEKDQEEYESYLSEQSDDYNCPEKRSLVFDLLNEWLFERLLLKIQQNSLIICKIFKALRKDGWYSTMANEYERTLKIRIESERSPMTPQSQNSFSSLGRIGGGMIPIIDRKSNQTSRKCSYFINFPEPIAYSVDRESKRIEITNHLRAIIKNGKGWLIIYGMRGSGKTVLAESTIRRLESLPFNDGVFWIPIGHINEDEMFQQTIYSKLEILHDSINFYFQQFRPKPDKLSLLQLDLKFHFNNHPHCLIVLDDVQNNETFKYFQFGVPILVTTFDKGLVPMELFNVRFVSTQRDDGNILNMEESLILLKNCISTKFDYQYLSRSQFIPIILERVNGFPYCIPLIANYMIPFIENNHKFNEENFQNLERLWRTLSKLINDNDWIDSLLDHTIESMDPKLLDCFYDFAIFSENVPIVVLQTLWDCDCLRIGQILQKLLQRSLIKTHYQLGENPKFMDKLFNVHDITAKYLKKKLGRKELKMRHRKLIDACLRRYQHRKHSSSEDDDDDGGGGGGVDLNTIAINYYDRFDLEQFAKEIHDKYIYRSLSYHIYSAGRFELFSKIYLNLNFIQNKIRSTGQSHLLSDYHYFERYFHDDWLKFEDFRRFIASNTEISDAQNDLLQIALGQLDSSIVHNEAIRLIEHNDRFYFDWCNKMNSLKERQLIKIDFRCDTNTRFAALSPNSRLIISVNGSRLHLWDSNIAELLHSVQHHYQSINFCCFSQDGEAVLTSDDEGRITLWRIRNQSRYIQRKQNRNSKQENTSRQQCKTIERDLTNRSSSDDENSIERRQRSRKNFIGLVPNKLFSHDSLKFKTDATNQTVPVFKCVDISPDNRYILAGTTNGLFYLFLVNNEQLLYSSINDDHLQQEISCCSFSIDGHHFLILVANIVFVYVFHQHHRNHHHLHNDLYSYFTLLKRLEHDFVSHNAIFCPRKNHKTTVIFSSAGKNILQWEIERNSLFQTNRNDDREIVMRKDEKTMMIPSLKYRLPDNGTGYISIVACSSNGNLIAGFEITRNEIYLWKRNNPVSHFFLHTFASIITMSFGYNDQCLFTLNSKSKITLWDIKDNDQKISLVELKDKFATVIDSEQKDLSILTIDKSGFLRLFRTLSGVEDKNFNTNLQRELRSFGKLDGTNETGSNELIRPRINIQCCDLSPNGQAIFGTDTGQTFFYRNCDHFLYEFNSKLFQTETDRSIDEIIQIKFLHSDHKPSSDQIVFVTFTQKKFTVYKFNNPAPLSSSDAEIRNQIELENFVRKSYDPEPDERFESIYFVSTSIILLWSQMNNFYLFELEDQNQANLTDKFNFIQCYGLNNSKITDIHSFRMPQNDYLMTITLAQNRLIVLNLDLETKSFLLLNSLQLLKNVPRCCRICSKFISYGCDNGDIYLLNSLQIDQDGEEKIFPFLIGKHSQSSWVSHLAISSCENFLISASDSIKLWSIDAKFHGTLLQTFVTQGSISQLFVCFDDLSQKFYPKQSKQHLEEERFQVESNMEIHEENPITLGPFQSNLIEKDQIANVNQTKTESISCSNQIDPKLLQITMVLMTENKSLYILRNYSR